MNYKSITTAIVVAALGLSACDNDTQDTKTQAQPEPEVPMSAEPAEPTGVMNAEPVVLEADEATSATDTISGTSTSSQ
ncbi:MAG: hypothetical protein Q4A69_07740 [Moraxella sp.]|nr:hypothetical protein [Moraxella sp.]